MAHGVNGRLTPSRSTSAVPFLYAALGASVGSPKRTTLTTVVGKFSIGSSRVSQEDVLTVFCDVFGKASEVFTTVRVRAPRNGNAAKRIRHDLCTLDIFSYNHKTLSLLCLHT